MKINENWLREWVNPPIEAGELAEQLTMAGLEVEHVHTISLSLDHIVTAEILSVAQHPKSDRLKVCEVSVGEKKPLKIVSGADNIVAGMRVPLAKPGTQLPGGDTIEVSRLQGVESAGMLCSAAELGLVDEADELLQLPWDTKPGLPLAGFLVTADKVIEFSLTPNRGDCLSVAGVAREVAALNGCPLQVTKPAAVSAAHHNAREVSLDAPAACARYAGRIIEDVNVSRPVPLWLYERLNRCGIRSINPIVDITNYVMLELGQPLHGFDNDRLQGAIHVRYANAGEQLLLLDRQECVLSEQTLVIADDRGPVALAGIMGGLDSAVSAETNTVFLESAWFEPKTIIGEARSYGIHTDSAHRFERGVDCTLQVLAIERVTQLIMDYCGGSPGPVTEVVSQAHLPSPATIGLSSEQIERVLGITIKPAEVTRLLGALGCAVEKTKRGWIITPPEYRFDLAIEADLLEELARMQGYNNIPVQVPRSDLRIYQDQTVDKTPELRACLVQRGYYEAITYSFIDTALQALFTPQTDSLALTNPISSDLSVMRASLWPGLINVLQYNLKRQQSRVRLFEIGRVFARTSKGISQERMVGGLIYGDIYNKQWDTSNSKSNFFDIKGDVETLLQTAGHLSRDVIYEAASHPALHPGQTAEIIHKNQSLGWLGAVHPEILAQLDITGACYCFELKLDDISQHLTPKYRKLSKFPAVRRDLALVVGEEIPLTCVTNCIKSVDSSTLTNLELFDVYQGEGVDLGKKSLALGLTFQRSSSTLTDEEVEAIVGEILAKLEREYGITLRE